jgi:pimeloyl-ACP methyl ester carboxylesterase
VSAGFLPAYERIAAAGAAPASWALVLHGIFGRGANWRSFARRLVDRRPRLGLVLVDLREHGASQGAPPPHTVAAAAEDLVRLADALEADGSPVRSVMGHSLGGKVALGLVARVGASLSGAWIFDSDPAARPGAEHAGETAEVLRALEAAPADYGSRDAFVDHLRSAGFSLALARWLAMSLVADGARYRLCLVPASMRALLTSYHATDAWPTVAAPPCALRFVLGGASQSVGEASRRRLAAEARVDVLAGAGHWLHVDALDALVALVAEGTPP